MPLQKSLIQFYRRKIKKPALFFLYFSFFLLFFFLIKRFFSVSVIEMVKDKNLRGLDRIKGRVIFFISPSTVGKELTTLNPEIKKVKIVKIYPNRIRIEVEKDVPVASFSVTGGYFLLSREGRILKKKREKEKDLPVINYYQKFYYQEYQTGDKLNYQDILDALYFITKFNYLELTVNSIDINSLNMIIFNLDGKKVFFTTTKERKQQYQALKKLIERFKIEKMDYQAIDLRFDKPIIKLK